MIGGCAASLWRSDQGPKARARYSAAVVEPSGYLLCGTPRTGSTLLCSLLASTDVLGRPQSYFREPDEVSWARRLGVAVDGGAARDYGAFVRAVRAAGTTDNGVFGARVMGGSLPRMVAGVAGVAAGLGTSGGTDPTDLAVLEAALGPLALVWLRREDVVAQAVSWCRAEQTGYWQQGDAAVRRPRQDVPELLRVAGTIQEHDAAWQSWFDAQGVRPHQVTYDELVHDPRATVEAVAAHLAVDVPPDWRPASPHRRQADRTNERWADALRSALPGPYGSRTESDG